MNLSLEKLEKYGFNHRILTEDDFYRICESEAIKVLELDAPTSFYFCASGQFFIVLQKKLKGLRKTFAMFHELSHHFLHGGRTIESAFFFGMLESKNEFEADALALIALLPIFQLKNFDFLDEHPNRFARKLYKDRQQLNFLYGI